MRHRLLQLHAAMGTDSAAIHSTNAQSRAQRQKDRVDVLASLSHKPNHKPRDGKWSTVTMLALLPMAIALAWWTVGRAPAHDALNAASPAAATAAVAAPAMAVQTSADAPPPQFADLAASTSSADAPKRQATPAAFDAQAPIAALPIEAARSADIADKVRAQLRARLESWRQAWADRDVDAYLAHYSPSFIGANGQTRSAWAAARRRVISSRSDIALNLSAIEMQAVAADRWELRFLQDYASGGYAEQQLPKTLVLVLENGDWHIVAEHPTRSPTPADAVAR
jgi:ketosteroid isomerase-like protein/methionine-rich copper-binding protein CopC